MILVSPALRRKTPSIIIWLFLPIGLGASVLQFPDSSGKVVAQKPDYVIRLIETPSSNIKTAEAMFLIKGSPFEIYKAVEAPNPIGKNSQTPNIVFKAP
jgi:hypothetical protein